MARLKVVTCEVCGQSSGVPPFCCLTCRTVTTLHNARWNFTEALNLAERRIASAAGVSRGAIDGNSEDPVQQALTRVKTASPATVRLMQALMLGTAPEELDRKRGGVRLMLEACVRSLQAAGIKTGEVHEIDVSERFSTFLTAFFDRPAVAERVALEHDPQEPARRLSE